MGTQKTFLRTVNAKKNPFVPTTRDAQPSFFCEGLQSLCVPDELRSFKLRSLLAFGFSRLGSGGILTLVASLSLSFSVWGEKVAWELSLAFLASSLF